MQAKHICFPLICVLLTGCQSWFPVPEAPQTLAAEVRKPYGYQPIDPVPVLIKPVPEGSEVTREQLLAALPDETMRMAVGQIDVSGNVTYGPVSTSMSGKDYVVTIDYVKSNTNSIPIVLSQSGGARMARLAGKGEIPQAMVPVYLGVGLRLTASVRTRKADINLGNLVALGAAAQAGDVSGTLVVQTLGLSGENISTALPIPTELSAGSIQTAIQALGTMKAKLYDVKTTVVPRAVGIYNNLGGDRSTIDGFITSLFQGQQVLYVPGTPQAAATTTGPKKGADAPPKKPGGEVKASDPAVTPSGTATAGVIPLATPNQ